MITTEQLKGLDECSVFYIFKNSNMERITNLLMKEYPDYYNLRGRDISILSEKETFEVKKLLRREI